MANKKIIENLEQILGQLNSDEVIYAKNSQKTIDFSQWMNGIVSLVIFAS